MLSEFDYKRQSFSLVQPLLRSAGEVEIYSFRDDSLGVSSVELLFHWGKLNSRKGLPELLMRLFPFLQKKEGETLSETLEVLGSKMSFEVSGSVSFLKIQSLAHKMDETLSEVLKALELNTISQEDYDYVVGVLKEDLKHQKTKKNAFLTKVLSRELYLDDRLEVLSELNDFSLPEISNEFESIWRSLGCVFELNYSLIDQQLSLFGFQPGRKRLRVCNGNKFVKSLPKVNNEQSLIIQKSFLGEMDISDFGSWYVYNQLFGGSFQSLLSQEIREKKGLTYGISSSLSFNTEGVFIQVNSTTPYGKGSEVLANIESVSAGVLHMVTDKFLEDFKKLAIVAFLKTSENVFSQMALSKNTKLNNLPNSFYDRVFEDVKKVDLESIARLHGQFVNKNKLNIEVV